MNYFFVDKMNCDTVDNKYAFLDDNSWGQADINLFNGRVEPIVNYPGDEELYDCRVDFDEIIHPEQYENTEDRETLISDFKQKCNRYYEQYKEQNPYGHIFLKFAEVC